MKSQLIAIVAAVMLVVGFGMVLIGEDFFRFIGLGRFGDEIWFIFIICVAVTIAALSAWNIKGKTFKIKNDSSEEEVRNLGFFLGWGGGYTFVCVAVPVWISQWRDEHFVFLGCLGLMFFVLIICVFIYITCKIKCSKEPTKRLVFLKRMSLIHILAAGLLILFAVMFIMSGALATV